MSLSNVSSRGLRLRSIVWLCACSALACLSCKAKLPDGVFVCSSQSDCPTGFTCRESLCRRGGAAELATSADAALPSETTGVLADAAADSGKLEPGQAGKRSMPSGSAGERARAREVDAGGMQMVVPPPPPPPFMPHTFVPLPSGRSVTAAGAYMQSGSYRLWTALGQAPGTGYPVRSSSNYRLVGGIASVLQSEP